MRQTLQNAAGTLAGLIAVAVVWVYIQARERLT